MSAIADNENPQSLASRLRRKRFAFFKALLDEIPGTLNILDVGGTEAYWRDSQLLEDERFTITLLNTTFASEQLPRVRHVRGDARALEFADGSFDVVYSNSVIEHVGGTADQLRMAKEIQRVGKRHFVQTPNYYFPVEPHFLVPGFQFLPLAVRTRLLQSFDLGWSKRERDSAAAHDVVDGVKLMKRREFASCFPKSAIYDERYLGLTKSFIAYYGFPSKRLTP